ncbi:MAG: methyltransferase domain-containing protein, partial [Candidatus Cloacimonadota bacterium]
GLSLADRAAKLCLIEEVQEAVEDAARNAELNKIRNAEFLHGKVEELLRKSLRSSFDTIIFDPPRAGLDDSIPPLVAKAGIHRVLYLSCNPMTLARDLKSFFAKGYKLVEIQPYDMFPQTWHIETLAVLQKV